MKYNKIIITTILTIFLFCIAGAYASDAGDDAVASEDGGIELTTTENNLKTIEDEKTINTTNYGEILSLSRGDDFASAENDLDVLGDDVGTYSGLARELDNSALWVSHYAQLNISIILMILVL